MANFFSLFGKKNDSKRNDSGLSIKMRVTGLHESACIHYQAGNLADAIVCYREILEIDPRDIVAHENLGMLYMQFEDLNGAEEHLTMAIRCSDQKSVGGFYNRGNLHSKRENWSQAIFDYSQTILLNKDHAWAYCNRGLCFLKLGKYQQAHEDFSEAVRLDPSDRTSRNYLAHLREMGY